MSQNKSSSNNFTPSAPETPPPSYTDTVNHRFKDYGISGHYQKPQPTSLVLPSAPPEPSSSVPRFTSRSIFDHQQTPLSKVSVSQEPVIHQQPTVIRVVRESEPELEDQVAECCCLVGTYCCIRISLEVCLHALVGCR